MNNKKVGIVTIYKNNQNYGGLLQAYALQQSVEDLGFDCEIVSYERNISAYRKERFKNLGVFRSFEVLLGKLKTKMFSYIKPKYRLSLEERNRRFQEFELEIEHSKIVNDENIGLLCKSYQTMICGSDQIWNPGLWNDVMFLNIDDIDCNRISYAASIGRNALTEEEQQYMAERLGVFNFISVREESAAQIVDQLTEKNVEVVFDPTFLLSAEQWGTFARRPKGCPDSFVFSFFLGKNTEAKKTVNRIYSGDVPIVTIPHLQTGYKKEDETYSDIQLYDVGPHEWVWLIQNAQCIFTDSFHGTAFSINLGKEFCSFPKGKKNDKQSINSRLKDVLVECGLGERFIIDTAEIENVLECPIDVKTTKARLEKRVEISRSFLNKALNQA